MIEQKKWKDYISSMKDKGYEYLQNINVDERCKYSELDERYGHLLMIRPQHGMSMFVVGSDIDPNYTHKFGMYITDSDGKEIPDYTRIIINKHSTGADMIRIDDVQYSDVKLKNDEPSYRLKKSFVIVGDDYHFEVARLKLSIPKENIRFKMIANFMFRCKANN